MGTIRPAELPAAASVNPAAAVIVDDGSSVERATPLQVVDAAIPLASQVEAEGGSNNVKRMTPLRVKQAITALWNTVSTFTQSGTGAVSRTAQDKMRDTVHLFDFVPVAKQAGILAGSNTDDLSAYFQAALDTGRPVLLPDTGMAWIASPIFVPSGGGLIGNGFNFTIKAKADFGNVALIYNETVDPATDAARDTGLIFSGFKIDGNRANNSTATELSHGLRLNAVDGAYLDLRVADVKGDGVLLSYAYPYGGGGGTHLNVGCRNIHGFIRSERAFRQGAALACIEQFDLSIVAIDAGYIGLDIEPDDSSNYVRDGFIRLTGLNCGLNPTGTGGGININGTNSAGTGVCDVRNIVIDCQIRDCDGIQFGGGILYRDATDIFVRGKVDNQTGAGVLGLDGFGISRVNLDIDIKGGDANGASLAGVGDIISGSIRVKTPGSSGVQVDNAAGGVLQVRVESAPQFGLVVGSSTADMIFANCEITGSGSSGVVIQGTANGNRFPNLRSTGALGFGYGVQETAGNNNRVTNATLTGNAQGPAALTGSTSLVEMEPLFGKATIDAASIADGAQGTIGTITVTGAAVGDDVKVTASVSFAGMNVWGSVTAANTVTVYGFNKTGGAVDLASATWKAVVTQRVTA
jgi:hypothetical protein